MSPVVANIRRQIAAVERRDVADHPVLPFGIPHLDARLVGGGLRLDALHELAAAGANWGDDAPALLFAAGIAARQTGPVLWVLRRRDLFAPALYQAGLAPARVIYAEARDDKEVLAVIEDALHHGGLAAIIGEVRKAGLTSTRRLQLAAEGGTTLTLLMRGHIKLGEDPLAQPSAAATRWRIAPVASTPLEIAGVGRARWNVELVRQRGGAPFEVILEGCDETGRCALAAELVDRSDFAHQADIRAAV